MKHLYREWEIGVLRELSDMLSLKQARLKINAGDTVGGDIIESFTRGPKFETNCVLHLFWDCRGL